MIYYLAEVGMVYIAKNKLCKEVQDYLRTWNRKLIPEEKISAVKKKIIADIIDLNNLYPRCKPVSPHFWQPGYKETLLADWAISFNGESIMSFIFLKGQTERL